jgi:hypothetical protein
MCGKLEIGGVTGGSGNLSTSLPNVARLTAHPKFVWVFNANYYGTIIYNDLYVFMLCNVSDLFILLPNICREEVINEHKILLMDF